MTLVLTIHFGLPEKVPESHQNKTTITAAKFKVFLLLEYEFTCVSISVYSSCLLCVCLNVSLYVWVFGCLYKET